jgi:hypothetical protein
VQIDHLEAAVRNVGKQLAARDQEFHAVTSSRGWRAVTMFRRVVHTARGLGTSRSRS